MLHKARSLQQITLSEENFSYPLPITQRSNHLPGRIHIFEGLLLRLLLCFKVIDAYSDSAICDDLWNLFWPPFVKFLKVELDPIYLCLPLLIRQQMRGPTTWQLVKMQVFIQDYFHRCQSNDQFLHYFTDHNFLSFLHRTFSPLEPFNRPVRLDYRSFSNDRRPRLNLLNQNLTVRNEGAWSPNAPSKFWWHRLYDKPHWK